MISGELETAASSILKYNNQLSVIEYASRSGFIPQLVVEYVDGYFRERLLLDMGATLFNNYNNLNIFLVILDL